MIAVSGVILIDGRGWILLQLRDEHAPIAANQWAIAGGHLEGEERPLDGAVRELAEETGIELAPEALRHWRTEIFRYADGHQLEFNIFWAATPGLTDADIVLGEGQAIVFVDPATVAGLDLGEPARHFLADFLTERPDKAG